MRKMVLAVLSMILIASLAFAKDEARRGRSAEDRSVASLMKSAQGAAVLATQGYWDSLKIAASDFDYLTVNALPGGVIWISGYQGYNTSPDIDIALRSTDAGATWTKYTLAFTNGAGVHVLGLSANVAVATTYEGQIHRTTDGGTNWTKVYEYGGGAGFFNGIVCTGGDSLIAVGDADASGLLVVKSTDAGATWTRFTNLPAAEATAGLWLSYGTYAQALDGIGSTVWITVEQEALGILPRLLRTTDFGATWTSADLTLTGGATNAWQIRSINMVDKNVGWLVPNQTASGVRSVVHKTTDGGATWSDTLLVERGSTVKAVKPVRGTNNLLAVGYKGNDTRAPGGRRMAASHGPQSAPPMAAWPAARTSPMRLLPVPSSAMPLALRRP